MALFISFELFKIKKSSNNFYINKKKAVSLSNINQFETTHY